MVLDDSVMRRSDALREMMRLARAILSDGIVSDAEAVAFQAWIDGNPDVSGVAKVEEIVGLLRNAFSDGRLTADERRRLAEALNDFQGS
jgi:hypothetical protein